MKQSIPKKIIEKYEKLKKVIEKHLSLLPHEDLEFTLNDFDAIISDILRAREQLIEIL